MQNSNETKPRPVESNNFLTSSNAPAPFATGSPYVASSNDFATPYHSGMVNGVGTMNSNSNSLANTSNLNPMQRLNDMDQAKKRLRRGTDFEDDSLPASTSNSHINSPSGSASPAILASPADDSASDIKPNSVLEMRGHLSQFALNSGPNSAASSNRGSVGPSNALNGSWVDGDGSGNPGMVQQSAAPAITSPPSIRPPGQMVRGRPAEQGYAEVDQNIAATRPAANEADFLAFYNIVLSQPTQMGFGQGAIREAWTNHNGDNKAAFDYLAKAFSQRTQQGATYLAQQQQQHAMRQHHAQQQALHIAQTQRMQQTQFNWQQQHPGQPFPMQAYLNQQAQMASAQGQPPGYGQHPGQYPPGQYPPGQYPMQARQQQFPSPYARNSAQQQQQQYQRGNTVNRAVEPARPRQPVSYNTSYAPRDAPRATLLPRYAQPLPPAGPLRKRKAAASDSDGEENYSDHSGDEYGGPSPAQMAAKNARAMSFFNECTKDELTELASCNPTQATLVIKLRPFSTPDDFRGRTRKQKGVGNNMYDTYLSVIDGMSEVDKVLDDCEQIGRDLSAIMRIWATGTETKVKREASDVGTNLTDAPDDRLVAAAEVSQDPVVRSAFEGYLRKQPDGVPDKIVLKDYQMLGVNWLALLYRRKTSCILADEMGLGKTAQVIALMAHLKAIGEKGPHLVIVPSSTLENWMREFSVFAPKLIVESYYGSQADRALQRHELREAETLDVIVTTYNIATSSADDQKFLRKKMAFNICVFDEGHQLKNAESKKYKDLMGIKAKWRCLLTGTPLQNNLQELVSLLSFILPDQFRDANESLRAIFKVGPSSSANLLSRERVTRAKKMMTPFVLRRKKAQVLKDLPKKFERIEWCEMTPLQREVHSEAMTRSKKALMAAEDAAEKLASVDDEEPTTKKSSRTSSKTGNKINETSGSNVLMDLRKASNHPMLFRRLYTDDLLREMSKECLKEEEFVDRDRNLIYEDMEVMTDFELHRFCGAYRYLSKYCLQNEEWMSAGKIIALQRMIPEMKANGDRILLFSQFTQVLEILEVVLDTMNIKYLKLTGQTNVTERQGLVDLYTNDPDITVFLLSTRAGGLGLNLTAANTVIMHDQDFNPHADKQAEDRSYRIGQVRDVNVIKLICKDSVEEMMRALATQKLLLDSEVSGGDATSGGGGEDETSTAQSEKKMRTSLLSNLKKKFQDGDEGPVAFNDGVRETGGVKVEVASM